MTINLHPIRTPGSRLGDLCAAVAWNLPVIGLAMGLTLRHGDLNLLGILYAVSVVVGYYGLPLLAALSLLFVLTLRTPRALRPLAVATTTIYTGFLFVDAVAYQVIKFHIDTFWLEYLFNDFKGLGLPASTIAAAVVGLLLVIGLQIAIFHFSARAQRPRFFGGMLAAAMVLLLAAGQIVHIVAYSQNDARVTSLTPLFPFYMPFTSHRNADKYGDMLPVDMREAAQDDNTTFIYPREPLTFDDRPVEDLPNILVFMLESWRHDMMDAEVSPRVFDLAQRSLVYENHLSTGNQTTCGVFGFFYGLHATYWATVKANSASIDNPVLIDALTDRGYDCRVFARSHFERHKIADTVFRGIDIANRFQGNSMDAWDRDLNDRLKSFIHEKSESDEPWFAYAFYKSTHFSYSYPESLTVFSPTADVNMALVNDDTPTEPIRNDYRNAVHYNDMLIGEILDELAAAGRLDDTVIIVTTDHGDEINDNGANYWGHGTNFTKWQVQVPLIMHLPGVEPGRITARTSHMDVVPTLLTEIFGCTTDPAAYSTGVDLLHADLSVPRPFVIGSYVNYAYVFGDDVFAIYPLNTRKYPFDDVTGHADRPPADLMLQALEQVGRFAIDPADTKELK